MKHDRLPVTAFFKRVCNTNPSVVFTKPLEESMPEEINCKENSTYINRWFIARTNDV
jgi:hypothetical protein